MIVAEQIIPSDNMEFDLYDLDALGVTVDGMTPAQIRKLKAFYQNRTHDMDLKRIDYYLGRM